MPSSIVFALVVVSFANVVALDDAVLQLTGGAPKILFGENSPVCELILDRVNTRLNSTCDISTAENLEVKAEVAELKTKVTTLVDDNTELTAKVVELKTWKTTMEAQMEHVMKTIAVITPPPLALASSCKEVLYTNPTSPSGVYNLSVTSGVDGNISAMAVYCDMDTAGGGWTLCSNWIDDGSYDLVEIDGSQFQFWQSRSHAGSFPSMLRLATAHPYSSQGSACETLRQSSNAGTYLFACAISHASTLHDAAAGPFPIDTLGRSLAGDPRPTVTMGSGTAPTSSTDGVFHLQRHYEYGWFGYTRSSLVVMNTTSYPRCGSDSCGKGVGWAHYLSPDVMMELGTQGQTAYGGQHASSSNWPSFSSGGNGISCGGIDTQGSTTDRFSLFLR